MPFSSTVRIDALRTTDSADIITGAGTYIRLTYVADPTGTGSFTHRMRVVKMTNDTDGDLFIAFTNGSTPLSDGTQDNVFLPAMTFTLYDFSSNSTGAPPFVFEEGTTIWVRQSSAPTSGALWVECVYAKGE